MSMQSFLHKYHSLLFSVITVIGFELSLIFLHNNGNQAFFVISSVFLLGFVVETAISFQYMADLKSKLPLPHLFDDIKHIHISHHIALPLTLYIGICSFIFFNSAQVMTQVIILLGGITIYSILHGQRQSFEHEFSFDETLHYIYDSIKIILYFLGIYTILSIQRYFSIDKIYIFIGANALTFFLFILILVRKQQFNVIGMIYIFVASTFLAIITTIFLASMNLIILTLLSSVIFYLLVGLIHHKLSATLSISVLLEYIVIAAIIFLALKGIS